MDAWRQGKPANAPADIANATGPSALNNRRAREEETLGDPAVLIAT